MYYNIKWTVVCAAEGDPAVAEKKRISVRIAGRFLTVVTDEDPASVRRIERTLNERVEEMGKASPRMATRDGKIDAVILCAFEALDRERTAESRIAEAERRATEHEERFRRLLEEYNRITSGGAVRESGDDTRDRNAENERYRETVKRIRERLTAIRDGGTI